MTVKELKNILENVCEDDKVEIKVFDNSTYEVDFVERGTNKIYIGIVNDLIENFN